jgi:23S rRNA (adenine2503-C2)-methyltransferase
VYVHGAREFAGLSNLAKDFRAAMEESFSLARPEVVTEQISSDGTRKWLLRSGGQEFETVFIPEPGRGTLCVSSQVGCTLNCRFCHTGTQKLVRNLTPGEIVGQVMVARDALGDWPSGAPPGKVETGFPSGGATRKHAGADRRITNVVMMGMGEPLYNFDNVKQALSIVADGDALAFSKRRVTLSTAGVVPMIPRAGAEIGSALAISLHAVRDEIRDVLVPLNKKYPLKELLDACRAYPGASNARRITFEYVMLKGVNDSLAEARELVKLMAKIPAKINLIPFNPWPGAPYECSEWEQIEKFAEVLNRAGYASPVRTPRGRDIMAACGQLKSESLKQRASERLAEMRSAELQRMVE